MYRANVPTELDVLDSPLLSPTPLGSAFLGNVPGSALAERIFNDPGSWETSEEYDDSALDQMAWLVDEVEKYGLHSASSSLDSASTVDGSMPEKANLVSSIMHARNRDTLMDIKRRNIRPISLASLFERSGEDFIRDIQPHLLKSGAELTPATADFFSPMSGSTDGSSVLTAATDKSEFLSAPIYSASTTLNFLDLYLDSPNKDAFRKSIQAKSRPRTPAQPPSLKIISESASVRPASIMSPSLSHPDMSVLPLKRGSSVPPLDTLALRQPEAAKPLADIMSPEPRLALPPGLAQPLEETKPQLTVEEVSVSQVVTVPDSIARALPQPTPPPAYSSRQSSPPRPLPQAQPSPSPSPAPAKTAGIIGQASTPVRRLPSIPPSTRSAVPSLNNSIASPLPTSLPTATSALLSPEPTQTILYQSRPMSAVRSPLGGPMGPRTRASAYNRHERTSSTGNRITSGLARRPPVLQL
ncbi:hypothetical protein FA15DRAFT_668000 [Coprinopsis marcescibilis]|uniref:Uncharacterized protein n=1 Tax=Coprinopsis marcescibilis TaxID=230819 RepID=A0A5C3KYU2_COPMA|nr:hypothetical protein FA15DRAFT_668000 [Coprinopsis marcescibilis]